MGVEVADRIKMVWQWLSLNGQKWVAVLVLRSGDLSGGDLLGCCDFLLDTFDKLTIPESFLSSRQWRGNPLLVCRPSTMARCSAARSSVFDDGAVFRCSLVGLDDGAVIRCSLVGFEWCALDGQESGVVPFGSELVKSFWENCLATRRQIEAMRLISTWITRVK